MLEVRSFRALRFSRERTGSLDNVITPPYDVITPKDRALLAGKSPFSMVHVTLPEEEPGLNRYQAAARILGKWLQDAVLQQDSVPSLYLLEQRFRGEDGQDRTRRGFLAVAKLPEPGENYILGHERTFANTTEDRLLLTESTQANLGPVFALYSDPANELAQRLFDQVAGREPEVTAHTLDDVDQRLWIVPEDPGVTEFLRDKLLYIADGHHRFRTACLYRDKMREREHPGGLRPYDYVLMGFVSLSEPGLAIYPTHRLMAAPPDFNLERLLEAAQPWFEVAKAAEADLEAAVDRAPGCTFGTAIAGAGAYLFTLRPGVDREKFLGSDHGPSWRDLDVAILHRGLIERVMGLSAETSFAYERRAEKALEAVAQGEYAFAFILKATSAAQIRACAEAGEAMPHKSTYFFPKLPTGAAIHRLV